MNDDRLGAAQRAGAGERPAPIAGRILLLDDDRIVLGSITALLQFRGYDVVPTSSAAAALRELGRSDFDVVIACLLYTSDAADE